MHIIFIISFTIRHLYFQKITPLKLHIARHHFKIKTQKEIKNKICETYSNKHNDLLSEKIDAISSGDKVQFPPKKMKSSNNDLIIFKNDNYESRNSDNNILKLILKILIIIQITIIIKFFQKMKTYQ